MKRLKGVTKDYFGVKRADFRSNGNMAMSRKNSVI